MKHSVAVIVALIVITTPRARGAVILGPVTNAANGHIYYLLSQASWKTSEAEALSLGGHLVTINDEAENDWVWSTFTPFASQQHHLWLGFTDSESEGNYGWVSGEPVTYTNWSPGEPNNEAGEDYAHMAGDAFIEHAPKSWNDILESGLGGGGIVTMPNGVVETVPSSTLGTPTNAYISTAVEIGWPSETNKMYQVQFAASVSPTIWFDFGAPIQGNGKTNYVFDTTRNRTKRFYQILVLP